MGIISWFTRWREDRSGDGPTLVVGNQDDDSDLDEMRRDAAADVAAVQQDAKYFGSSAQADRDGGI
ncbi:MAG TPA: hypothetical protein VHO07_12485 [Streptosporangiaceae bacterium]|jgi:hypothetical protein|nr:hypothetical protein [Streptosporangiaceae bacterium]